SGEISTTLDLSLSYLAQDSRCESSNTIYYEMLHVFYDLRTTEKRLRSMEEQRGSLSGSDLDQRRKTYESLSEDFRLAG
ncbi:multidrug ABC transporter ATP-binding protein, partial [Streptococcus suis]